MNIDFRKLILELSDESFGQLKEILAPFTWNYFVKDEEITKEMELEKIGEYLRFFEISSKLRDGDLAKKYIDVLIQYIDNRTIPAGRDDKPCQAERYFRRAKAIQKNINTFEDSDDQITALEDFSKIFLCIYDECIKDIETQISKINFHAADIDLKNLIEFYMKDAPAQWRLEQKAPEQLKKVIPHRFLKGADEVKKGLGDMQKGIQDAQKDFGGQLKKLIKKEDTVKEPVHDFLEYLENAEIFSEKSFTVLMLTIFYLRIRDYELGLC